MISSHLCVSKQKSCTRSIRMQSALKNGNICLLSGGNHHNYRERAADGGLQADWALCGFRRAFPMIPYMLKTSKASLWWVSNVAGCSLHFKEHGKKKKRFLVLVFCLWVKVPYDQASTERLFFCGKYVRILISNIVNVFKDADYTNYVEIWRPLWLYFLCWFFRKIWGILVSNLVKC